jgi:hypothetical protein
MAMLSNYLSTLLRDHMTPVVIGVVLMAACHRSPPPQTDSAARTVFTDSLLHAERCAPVQSGEDWRKVCTPRDQSLIFRKLP